MGGRLTKAKYVMPGSINTHKHHQPAGNSSGKCGQAAHVANNSELRAPNQAHKAVAGQARASHWTQNLTNTQIIQSLLGAFVELKRIRSRFLRVSHYFYNSHKTKA